MLLDVRDAQGSKEAFPAVTKATVVWNPERHDNAPEVAAMQGAAARLGVALESRQVRTPGQMRDLLDALPVGSTQAILNAGDTLLSSEVPTLVAYTARMRLPSLFENREYPDAGGLMSYGPNFPGLHRSAADHVDKILKGAKPADMPFQQPTKFGLVINRNTAKALGFSLPRSLLPRRRSDRVIVASGVRDRVVPTTGARRPSARWRRSRCAAPRSPRSG